MKTNERKKTDSYGGKGQEENQRLKYVATLKYVVKMIYRLTFPHAQQFIVKLTSLNGLEIWKY